MSSLFLWEQVERAIAKDKRRRLTKSLLLFVQLAIVALFAAGLADPRFFRQRPSIHLGIIVDTSASMAMGPGGSRAALARAQIERFLSEGEADRYLLWSTTGDLLRYDGPSKTELLAHLAALPPPAGSSEWEELARQIAAKLSDDAPLHLVIVSDGAVDPDSVSPLMTLKPSVEFSLIDVGEPWDNIGITRFSARASGRDDGHHQILLEIENFGHQGVQTTVTVVAFQPGASRQDGAGGLLIDESSITVAPGGKQRIVLEHSLSPGDSLYARVESNDPFPLDDTAFLVASSKKATRVLLVGEEIHFLRQGFAAFPHVETVHSFRSRAALDPGASYDLVVFFDEEVPNDFQGSALVVTSGPSQEGLPAAITWWDRRHPFSRFVDWESVSIGLARPLSPLPVETVLLQSTAGPLLTLLEEPERRIVRLAVPLFQSDLPFRIAFPVFLQNVLDWADPDGNDSVPHPSRPGTLPAIVEKALREGESLVLQQPSGEVHHLVPGEGHLTPRARSLVLEPGVYSWQAGSEAGTFAVSLLDREESDLSKRMVDPLVARGATLLRPDTDRLESLVPSTPRRRDAPPSPRTEELGRWVGLIGIALLLIEGRLYTWRRDVPGPDPELLSGETSVSRRRRTTNGGSFGKRGGRRRWRWG